MLALHHHSAIKIHFLQFHCCFHTFFSHQLVKLDPLVGPDLSLKIHPLLALRAFCNSLKTLYFALRVEWKFETLKMWLLKSLYTSAALTCVNSNSVADFTSSVALWYSHSHSHIDTVTLIQSLIHIDTVTVTVQHFGTRAFLNNFSHAGPTESLRHPITHPTSSDQMKNLLSGKLDPWVGWGQLSMTEQFISSYFCYDLTVYKKCALLKVETSLTAGNSTLKIDMQLYLYSVVALKYPSPQSTESCVQQTEHMFDNNNKPPLH